MHCRGCAAARSPGAAAHRRELAYDAGGADNSAAALLRLAFPGADIIERSIGASKAGAGIGWLRGLANLVRPLAYLYWRVAKGKVLGVRAIARDEHGRILLVEHTYPAGWWLPGGGVEAGETVFDAVERELGEETGVTIAWPPRLLSLHTHRESFADDHIAICLARIDSVRPISSREIRRVELCAPEALPWEQIDGGCARRLRES